MKISTLLRISVAVLLVFSLISTFSVYYGLSMMADDGNVVNYAGRLRATSQRLAKLVYVQQVGIDKSSDIASTTAAMDRIIEGLLKGDAEWKLPPATDSGFIQKLKEVQHHWGKFKEDMKAVSSSDKASLERFLENTEVVLKAANEATIAAANVSEAKVGRMKIIQVFILIINLIILAAIWFIIQIRISRPLSELNEKVEAIAKGDLSVAIESKGRDEIGSLSESMKTMVNSFNQMIKEILKGSQTVVSSVSVLMEKAQKTDAGAQNQSSQAHQIATAAEEMSQTITDIARNAAVASETSEEAMKIAHQGKGVAEGAVQTVNNVYTSSLELSTMVEKLNGRVGEIGDIITVIKDIADQTNLLALNAAIEAARAGEQGRGFAVVADEVRKLAEKTIKATEEISAKISAVQTESEQTMRSMEHSSSEVTKATDYIRQVGDSLTGIVEAVQKVRDQITQIATAVDEQSAASEEVAKNIEKTSSIAKEMEAMAADVMEEIRRLSQVAEGLRNSTARFVTR